MVQQSILNSISEIYNNNYDIWREIFSLKVSLDIHPDFVPFDKVKSTSPDLKSGDVDKLINYCKIANIHYGTVLIGEHKGSLNFPKFLYDEIFNIIV